MINREGGEESYIFIPVPILPTSRFYRFYPLKNRGVTLLLFLYKHVAFCHTLAFRKQALIPYSSFIHILILYPCRDALRTARERYA